MSNLSEREEIMKTQIEGLESKLVETRKRVVDLEFELVQVRKLYFKLINTHAQEIEEKNAKILRLNTEKQQYYEEIRRLQRVEAQLKRLISPQQQKRDGIWF
jgi:hypothetical protein